MERTYLIALRIDLPFMRLPWTSRLNKTSLIDKAPIDLLPAARALTNFQ